MRTRFTPILAASLTLILSGCQTVQDQRMPLSPSFAANAEVISIKKPVMQFKDKHFEQLAADFDIHSMNISRGRTERSKQFFSSSGSKGITLQTSDRFSRFIWDQLLGLQAANKIQYELAAEREYRFQVSTRNALTDANQIPIEAQCQIFYFDRVQRIEREVVDKKGKTSTSTETQNERVQSFLRCELVQGAKSWILTLDMEGNQPPLVHLGRPISEDADDFYQIDTERGNQYLVNGQWRESPFQFKTISGLHIFKKETQVGAMSFEGQMPKVWLNRSNNAETRKVLFTASYALMMYDWLDKDWRDQ
jgi:hypothetical protein